MRFVGITKTIFRIILFAQAGIFAETLAITGEPIMTNVGHPEDKYGKKLDIVKELGIGPTMAARVADNMLYTIGQGRLHIFDISNPADPELMGLLDGLGNTRQISVSDGIAYITAREDGVFIVDVGEPQRPKLLCHYDPIEVATGADISGQVLFVTCRHHGVELVDVSEPEKPLHLSAVRTGEAQSVAVWGGYAYVGVWGTSELVVVDVKNAREPGITARCPLDGYGDGVAVRGKYVYVATGHHSRERRTWYPGKDDPGYGHGHGLEIFDISNSAEPIFVSRIKTPRFYKLGNDMWSVKVAGSYAFVADTHNGVFVVNIKDPKNPYFVAHRQLPYVADRKLSSFAGGLALAKDYIYVAGGWTDLHVVAAPGVAEACSYKPDASPPFVPPSKPESNSRFRIYRPDGQVHAVDFMGNTAVIAVGSDGLHLVDLWPEIRILNRYDTEGFALGVKVDGERVYVAEGEGGLSIWRKSDPGTLTFQSRYQPRGQIVRDIEAPLPGKYALLQVNLSILDIVDVSNPFAPKRVFRDEGHGFVYHIGDKLTENRYAFVLWQLDGLRWYNVSGSSRPGFTGDECAHRFGNTGAVMLDNKHLVVYSGGFLLLERRKHEPSADMRILRIDDHPLRGKPRLYDSKLYISNKATGDISVIDISDINNPKLIEYLNIPGNPGKITLHNGILIIPNGYEGLWIGDK